MICCAGPRIVRRFSIGGTILKEQEQKKHRSGRRLFKGLLFLAACGLVMAIVVYTPIFTLQRVEVSGASYLTKEQICEIGRIHTGEPLFQLQTDAVAQNLMHDLRIESAVVRRRLPDRLEIEVTERKPVATVACDYGYLDLDRSGTVIAAYRALHSVPIPLITGMEVKGLYLGDEVTDENVKKVLYFLNQIDAEALNQISEVNIANPDAVVAYANSSVQIRLGKLDRLDEKAVLTADFVKSLKTSRHTIDYVDFSYEAPFIKLKDFNPDLDKADGKS